MINCLQINLNGCWAAQQLLTKTTMDRDIGLLILSEHYRAPSNFPSWAVSSDGKCSIALTDGAGQIAEKSGSGPGFAWLRLRDAVIFSCYWSPNGPTAADRLESFNGFLDGLNGAIRSFVGANETLVIAGDFNAKSPSWGSSHMDAKGEALETFASSLGLWSCNSGGKPTFQRATSTSIIDITFSGPGPWEVTGWMVTDDYTGSDHQYIQFELGYRTSETREHSHSDIKWAFRKLNCESLIRKIGETSPQTLTTDSADDSADKFNDFLVTLCDASMPRRTKGDMRRRPVHWWSEEISDLRGTCIATRRAYLRTVRRRGPAGSGIEREAYRVARKTLRTAIRASQDRSWNELCLAVDNDPWGIPYRVVTKKLGRQSPGVAARGRENLIADVLFPERPTVVWQDMQLYSPGDQPEGDSGPEAHPEEPECPPLSLEELRAAAVRLPRGKATGPDGVPNEVLSILAKKSPDTLLGLYSKCISETVFPRRWKRSRLVLLHKGADKPLTNPSSFRPLCMLDTAGKLLERVLLQRLNQHLDLTGGLSSNQFGFRRGKSTEDAISRVLDTAGWACRGHPQYQELCVLVTLDVKNAFNTAPWEHIDSALRARRVPEYLVKILRSYMTDRVLLVHTADGTTSNRTITCGVPQGSVLGPTLWNVFYDDLLKIETPPGVQLIGFADDLALVAAARTSAELEAVVNPTLVKVIEWTTNHGIQLAQQKTEAIILSRKRNYQNPVLMVGNFEVQISRCIRYLGVLLDSHLTFRRHIEVAASKALKTAGALSRLMPNVGGPALKKRALLMSVVNSKLLYAAPTWANRGTKYDVNIRAMIRTQRIAAIRMIRGYRTVSSEAALYLADFPPGDLLALERARIKGRMEDTDRVISTAEIRKVERAITIGGWQARWTRGPNARWTKEILPNVRRWMERPRVDLNFHMTQLLTGHGCFRSYLHRMNRAPGAECLYCGHPEDTARHTVFDCTHWAANRLAVNRFLGGRDIQPSDVEDILCGPEGIPSYEEAPAIHVRMTEAAVGCRTAFYVMVEEILSSKEQDERDAEIEDA